MKLSACSTWAPQSWAGFHTTSCVRRTRRCAEGSTAAWTSRMHGGRGSSWPSASSRST